MRWSPQDWGGWWRAAPSSCCGSWTHGGWATETCGCLACSGSPWATWAGRSCSPASTPGSCWAGWVACCCRCCGWSTARPIRSGHSCWGVRAAAWWPGRTSARSTAESWDDAHPGGRACRDHGRDRADRADRSGGRACRDHAGDPARELTDRVVEPVETTAADRADRGGGRARRDHGRDRADGLTERVVESVETTARDPAGRADSNPGSLQPGVTRMRLLRNACGLESDAVLLTSAG